MWPLCIQHVGASWGHSPHSHRCSMHITESASERHSLGTIPPHSSSYTAIDPHGGISGMSAGLDSKQLKRRARKSAISTIVDGCHETQKN